ncbi:MAG: type II secretion system F family protein [Candidatus Baltobacteraceae bacterium]
MVVVVLITLGVAGIAGALAMAYGSQGATFAQGLYEKADLRAKVSYLPHNASKVLIVSGSLTALLVGGLIFVLHASLMIDMVLLLVGGVGAYGAGNLYLSVQVAKRQKAFMPQLELVLRMIASSLSVGLGLRQAIVLVTEDVPEPARTEFLRIIGRTNIGISILDAIDEMSERMPSSEMLMTARAIRVQSQTGGDLANVLNNVASTIQARRTLQRKMSALTAEGRISGFVILSLPFGIGAFICVAQPTMGHALFFTPIGQASIALAIFLEAAAGFSLSKIMRFDP